MLAVIEVFGRLFALLMLRSTEICPDDPDVSIAANFKGKAVTSNEKKRS